MSQPLYSTINMNTFPGEMPLPGKTLKQQAINVDYEDIPRDIQVMRQQAYNKEVKEGEFVKEFSGLSDYFSFTPILCLVIGFAAGAFVQFKFFKKKVSARKKRRNKK